MELELESVVPEVARARVEEWLGASQSEQAVLVLVGRALFQQAQAVPEPAPAGLAPSGPTPLPAVHGRDAPFAGSSSPVSAEQRHIATVPRASLQAAEV